MADKKKELFDSEGREYTKTELANKIAEQSEKMSKTYQNIESGLMSRFRWISSLIDKILFTERFGALVALGLSILLYVVVNFNSVSSLYTSSMKSAKDRTDFPVTVRYNAETFELSGLPEKVDIVISGDAANVNTAASLDSTKIVADLEGLTEGEHNIKFKAEGFGDNVNVAVNPSNVIVTLKKKTTRQYDVSYDFINSDQMDDIYSASTPLFDTTKVNVRASKDTLDSIAFIKVLIDVSGQTEDFEQDAKLVAYNSQGYPVNADIVPDTVHVSVPVTSPSKSVPIEVQVTGTAPEGMAVNTVSLDQQSVTIYGMEDTLAGITSVVVTLDASTISKDSTILRPVVLPAGVTKSSITQVTMNVQLAAAETKKVDNVKIYYRNNTNKYKASQPDNITTTSITVTGSAANIAGITADDITVYVDMSSAVPGLQEFPLQVDQPADGLIVYSLTDTSYILNVLGETTETDTENEGADVNNG